MASAYLQFGPHPKPLNSCKHHLLRPNHFIIKCTSNPTTQNTNPPTPNPTPESDPQTDRFAIIEKRRKSEIIRDRKAEMGIVKPDPPNFEIGWKRTKEIKLEKPKGYVIMDFLEKLEGLMAREYGSTELLAKTGEIVAERAREEAEVLKEGGEVEERLVTELFRVLRLMEMDLAMVKAAVKEETLKERLEQAKARCRNLVASIRDKVGRLLQVEFKHVFRELNQAADYLAGLSFESSEKVFNFVPPLDLKLSTIVREDFVGKLYVRRK